jgi:hypothetical protein
MGANGSHYGRGGYGGYGGYNWSNYGYGGGYSSPNYNNNQQYGGGYYNQQPYYGNASGNDGGPMSILRAFDKDGDGQITENGILFFESNFFKLKVST